MIISPELNASISDYKFVKFLKYDNLGSLVTDKIEPIVMVDTNNYLAEYLITGRLTSISDEGDRLDILNIPDYSEFTASGDKYDNYLIELLKVPTGITESGEPKKHRFRGVLYKGSIIIENTIPDSKDEQYYPVIQLLSSDEDTEDNVKLTITELTNEDRYIIIYNKDISKYITEYHKTGVAKHAVISRYVTDELIKGYSEITGYQAVNKNKFNPEYTGAKCIFYK